MARTKRMQARLERAAALGARLAIGQPARTGASHPSFLLYRCIEWLPRADVAQQAIDVGRSRDFPASGACGGHLWRMGHGPAHTELNGLQTSRRNYVIA
eukprot:scaffold6414_cov148-Isochrysis_galbana.AAC.3